jgi:GDP-D-mannose dehydratase
MNQVETAGSLHRRLWGRLVEVEFLLADASEARRRLAWEPKVTFPELVRSWLM